LALVGHDFPALPARAAAVLEKGYDRDASRQLLAEQGIEAVIPGQATRPQEIVSDKEQDT
jgi:hypothetical protein